MRLLWKGIGLLLSVLSLSCLVGCSQTPPPPTPSAASTPAAKCGDLPGDTSVLLNVDQVHPTKRGPLERSATAATLNEESCASASGRPIPTSACTPDGFPWPSSTESQSQDLYARGAAHVASATFTNQGRPVFREVVVSTRPGTSLTSDYRAHILSCGAKVLSTQNGQPTSFSWPNNSMVVSLSGNAIIGLVSLNDEPAGKLLATAETIAAKE